MKYKDCVPISESICKVFLVKSKNDPRFPKLFALDKSFTIDKVVEMLNNHGYKNFTIQNIDVGEFNLDNINPVTNSFSLDGRELNQDMDLVI